MSPADPGRRAWLRILTGTRPGLERLLLAWFPALLAGSAGYFLFGGWAGLAIAFGVLALVVVLSRGVGE
jgi:hypothetical protein